MHSLQARIATPHVLPHQDGRASAVTTSARVLNILDVACWRGALERGGATDRLSGCVAHEAWNDPLLGGPVGQAVTLCHSQSRLDSPCLRPRFEAPESVCLVLGLHSGSLKEKWAVLLTLVRC